MTLTLQPTLNLEATEKKATRIVVKEMNHTGGINLARIIQSLCNMSGSPMEIMWKQLELSRLSMVILRSISKVTNGSRSKVILGSRSKVSFGRRNKVFLGNNSILVCTLGNQR